MANKGMGGRPLWRQHGVTAGVAVIAAVFGLAAALVVSGREKASTQAPIISSDGSSNSSGADPALANMANPVTSAGFYAAQATAKPNPARVLSASAAYAPQSSGESYPPGQQAPAPIVRGNSSAQNESLRYNTQPPVTDGSPNSGDPNGQYSTPAPNGADPNAPNFDNQGYADTNAQEDAGYEALEQANQAPPPLPEYDQPPAPSDNYLWTPGYWGYTTGYYWIPGAWVAPPFYGALWTPPWWGWYGGRYFFHRGYWGTHIGYYGGINYGYGYVGSGFYGGYWQGRSFYYNRAVTNVNFTNVHNVYNRTVVVNNVTYTGRPMNRTSFNGPGGVRAQPRPYEVAAMHEARYAPVPAQVQARQTAASNRGQFFAQNNGRPAEAFHPNPLGSNGGIANAPQFRPPPPSQSSPAQSRPVQSSPALSNPANLQRNQAGFARPQANAAEITRAAAPNGATGTPRNDSLQQGTGLSGGDRERNLQRNLQTDQQHTLQMQQQQQHSSQVQEQRDAADQQRSLQVQQQQQLQQRNFQLQQQQQRDAAEQQRNNQLQQQQRNQQFQQQREAAESQRSQQFQQQQQQRQAVEQQQRTQQIQQAPQPQQRTPAVQPRPAQPQPQQQHFGPAAQHMEARPSPQPHMAQAHAAPSSGGPHGRP